MSRKLSFALALACCVLMVACSTSVKPSPMGNGGPVSLVMRDTLPKCCGPVLRSLDHRSEPATHRYEESRCLEFEEDVNHQGSQGHYHQRGQPGTV